MNTQVNWVKFLTNVITEIIDRDFASLKGTKLGSQQEVDTAVNEYHQKLKPVIGSLAFIWRVATNNGSKDDLHELQKIIDETLNKDYLTMSREGIKQKIAARLAELGESR